MAFDKIFPFEDPKELKSLLIVGATKGTNVLLAYKALTLVSVETYAVITTTQSVFTVFFA